MALSQWYELRVAGSAGTRSELARGISEGIAMDRNGRLCAIGSAQTMRFATEQEACDFLAQTTIPKFYNFETVSCRPETTNGKSGPSVPVRSAG